MSANSGSFQPGQSGNPGGRRKDRAGFEAFRDRCRAMEPEALEALKVKISEGDLKAVEMVLHYAWGKPPQVVAGEGGEGRAVIEIVRRIVDANGNDLEDAV
jgi:hypothetical protein